MKMITGIWALMIFLHASLILAENPQEPASWAAYLVNNGPGELPMCFVSLLSRTAGRKAESTDLLITLANCIMTMTENGLQEVNAQDLLVQFLHFDLNGHQDDQFESAIAQVLFQDDGKSGEDRMALLQMVENVTSRLDLQLLIVPSWKPHLYEKCSMTGWLQKLDDKNYSTPIPTVFNVELTEETCNNFNMTEEERTRQTDDKKPYRFEIVAGTPIVCYTNSENSPQVQGFVKQSFHDQSYRTGLVQCTSNTNFYDWTKETLDRKLI